MLTEQMHNGSDCCKVAEHEKEKKSHRKSVYNIDFISQNYNIDFISQNVYIYSQCCHKKGMGKITLKVTYPSLLSLASATTIQLKF